MQIDRFTIEILEDGTIKTTTDAVSAANHDNAEQFLRAMAHLAGGQTERERRTDVKLHHHDAHQHTKAPLTEQRG
jgi:hypothetical protein